MGCWDHLPMKIFGFAMLVVAVAFELAGATIPADPIAAEGVVNDDRCSLHEAIWEANFPGAWYFPGEGLEDECQPGSAGADKIELTVGGLYNLTQADNTSVGANGLPVIVSDITIDGRTATIRRDPSYTTCDGTHPDFRFFEVRYAGVHLKLEAVTLTNGCGDINLGGAVFVDDGARLTVSNSTVSGNQVHGAGGGICVWEGDRIAILNSNITGNIASGSSGNGGGIYVRSGNLVVNSSTVSGNSCTYDGGGILLWGDNGVMPVNRITLNNSTVSGNIAGRYGGGIYSRSWNTTFTVLTLYNSTVTDNGATSGGGIYNAGAGAWVSARNSIVAEQRWLQDCYNSGGTYHSYGYNLESGTSCGFTAEGDQQNVDPVGLHPLGDYGGPTETCTLLFGSPAIDAGDPGGCYGDGNGDGVLDGLAMVQDQRGWGYWRPTDGDGDGIARCDAGAVESQILFADGFETGDTSAWSSAVP